MQIRKAQRQKAKLRLGLVAPSGAGKTYSSLLLAFGLGGKVGMIDTEHGSGDLYADLGDYDIISMTAPFTVRKYLDALRAFEAGGYSTIIIDSLSHAWAGDGGLLDKQGKIADQDSRGNSYAAWRKITPEHNALVEAMLQSPCHIIATMRAKQEYVQDKDDRGKTIVRKVGLAPVQRDGMEYEFTVVLDIDQSHVAKASKDRTSMFDGELFRIDRSTGAQLLQWLEGGVPAISQSRAVEPAKEAFAPADIAAEPESTPAAAPIDRDAVLAAARADENWRRIETLLTRNVEVVGDVTRILKAESNAEAIASWPEPWRDVMREIARDVLDAAKKRRPHEQQAA